MERRWYAAKKAISTQASNRLKMLSMTDYLRWKHRKWINEKGNCTGAGYLGATK
jgi:hypothetical protein